MNCLEFRRLVEIDPEFKEPDFRRHKAECGLCAELAARALHFSSALHAAARVEAPENLSQRILLRQSFAKTGAPTSRRTTLIALAAGILVAAVLALSGTYVLHREDPLARDIFTLISQADESFASQSVLDGETVASALDRVGLDLTGELEKVTFAGQSLVRGKLAGHLVIQGEWAPCTVLLIPETDLASRYSIERDNLRGLVVPFNGGVLAIIGAPQENLAPVVERVKAALRWRHA